MHPKPNGEAVRQSGETGNLFGDQEPNERRRGSLRALHGCLVTLRFATLKETIQTEATPTSLLLRLLVVLFYRRESCSVYTYEARKQGSARHWSFLQSHCYHAIAIMNSLANEISERRAAKCLRFSRFNKKYTITSPKIQTAVHLLLPAELAKHSVYGGTKPVTSTKAQVFCSHASSSSMSSKYCIVCFLEISMHNSEVP